MRVQAGMRRNFMGPRLGEHSAVCVPHHRDGSVLRGFTRMQSQPGRDPSAQWR